MTTRHRTSNNALSKAQTAKLIEGITIPRDKLMIKLGIYSGCRVRELVSLQISKCDFVQNTISVWDDKHNTWTWKKDATGKRVKDTKISEGKWRKIYMPAWLMQELAVYIGFSTPVKLNMDSQKVELAKREYVWDIGWLAFERVIQKWSSRLLHVKKSWHCLRHTFMSLQIEAGASIPYLVAQTGDTPETIMKVYAQISPDALRNQTEKPLV